MHFPQLLQQIASWEEGNDNVPFLYAVSSSLESNYFLFQHFFDNRANDMQTELLNKKSLTSR